MGPLFDSNMAEDDPESKPIGSLVFFNAINDEEAKETAEGDPYNEAGLFDSVFIARCVFAMCGRVHAVVVYPGVQVFQSQVMSVSVAVYLGFSNATLLPVVGLVGVISIRA